MEPQRRSARGAGKGRPGSGFVGGSFPKPKSVRAPGAKRRFGPAIWCMLAILNGGYVALAATSTPEVGPVGRKASPEAPQGREAPAKEGPEMYRWLEKPLDMQVEMPDLVSHVSPFRMLLGHSYFGDLFLEDPETRTTAVLIAESLELYTMRGRSADELRRDVLAELSIVGQMLRPEDHAALEKRLGRLVAGEIYYPVPSTALGGSGALETYDKGDLAVHLSILAQFLGYAP